MENVDLLYSLARITMNYALLVYGDTGIHAKATARIKDLRPGDLVMEQTSVYQGLRAYEQGDKAKALQCFQVVFGRFVEIERRTLGEPGNTWQDDIYHIDTLNGQRTEWSNCSFVALPDRSLIG